MVVEEPYANTTGLQSLQRVTAEGMQAQSVAQSGQRTVNPTARTIQGSSPGAPTSQEFLQVLTNSGPQQQKQLIGEELYRLIYPVHSDLAGKITGMLLEMDNSELLHMLEVPESLKAKVEEAVSVLRDHQLLQDVEDEDCHDSSSLRSTALESTDVLSGLENETELGGSSALRPMPNVHFRGGFVMCNGRDCQGEHCTFAHSQEELRAWNSQRFSAGHDTSKKREGMKNKAGQSGDHTKLMSKWSRFQQRVEQKIEDIQEGLTELNYREKFHKLLCWEKKALTDVLIQRYVGSTNFRCQYERTHVTTMRNTKHNLERKFGIDGLHFWIMQCVQTYI